MAYSAIEQFTIISLLQLSNFSITLLIVLFSVYLFSFMPSFLLYMHIKYWYSNLMEKEQGIIFIILTIWLIIFFSNIIGMIPYSFTLTAQALLVFSISIPTFISLNLVAIGHHRSNIFFLFLPSGAPVALTPLIALIEFIAYFIRALSLTLRLSANMVSGHILIKIILYSLINLLPIFSILLIPILLLELLVAFLQSYVFILLLISYYNDILIPH
jgi:F-type H+-transporting ATPase subunit a